jgi:plasmid stability protein
MGTLIQIKDVPEDVHAVLKSRAALAGVSLSEYVRGELARVAGRPTPEEFIARVRARGPAELGEPSEVTIRRLRDALE